MIQPEQRLAQPAATGSAGKRLRAASQGSRRKLASSVVVVGGVVMLVLGATHGVLLEVLLTAGITLTIAGVIDVPREVQPRRRYLSAGIALLYVGISAETLFRSNATPVFFTRGLSYGVVFVVWGVAALARDVRDSRRVDEGT